MVATKKVAGITTTEMDKTFDFTSFLAKKVEDDTRLSVMNTIEDDTIKKGLLKTQIAAGNGMFEYSESYWGHAIHKVHNTGSYNGLGVGEELTDAMFITHNEWDKLPKHALGTVLEWYRRIQAKNGEEAQVNFYYIHNDITTVEDENGNEVELKDIPGVHFWTDKLFSYTPKQYNHGTLTEVADEDEWYDTLNHTYGMYIETHSHNSMDAFASGTDIENSGNDGFQLVFGHFGQPEIEMYSWATASTVVKNGLEKEDLDFIVELPESADWRERNRYYIPVEDLEFDESVFDVWDQQVIPRPRPQYATYATAGYTAGTGAYTQSWGGYQAAGSEASSWYGYGADTYTSPRRTRIQVVNDTLDDWNSLPSTDTITITAENLYKSFAQVYAMGYDRRNQQAAWIAEGTNEMQISTDAQALVDTINKVLGK